MSQLVDQAKAALHISGTSDNQASNQSTSNMSSEGQIPSEWKAAVVKSAGKITVETVKSKPLKPNQVLLKVHANGVCHSDLFTYHGQPWPIDFPRVPGHEIVGELVAKGSEVPEGYKIGGRYGRGWFGSCCFSCDACRRGNFTLCANGGISGITDDGGYAQYVSAPWESLAKVPDNLKSEEAAPLLCAGVTVFNSLRNAGAQPPATVAVVGIGGLGHLAIQYARAMGYRVIAISSSDKKKDLAMKLGAHDFIDASKGNPGELLQKNFGGARVILNTQIDAKKMAELANNGLTKDGVFLVVGVSGDPMGIQAASLIGQRSRLQGWPSGTSKDSEDTLLFASLHGIRAHVTTVPLEKSGEAIDAMEKGTVQGRQVIVPN